MAITALQIRSARKALGWTQDQLADKAGVGTATIKRYETEGFRPGSQLGTIEKIERALQINTPKRRKHAEQ